MKYIDAEKLIAEIERRKKQDITMRERSILIDIETAIESLQQEQPVTKELSSHLEHWLAFFGCPEENIEKCATQIAQGYGAIRYLEGIQHGAEAVNELAKQEKPDFDDVDPKHLVHSHYTKVRETKTGRVFWAEYSSEAAEWFEAGTGKAYSISEVEIVKEQPEVEFEKEIDLVWAKCNPIDEGIGVEVANIHIEAFNIIARHFYGLRNRALEEAARHVYESWMGGTMDDVRRDMVELGKVLNAKKEESK